MAVREPQGTACLFFRQFHAVPEHAVPLKGKTLGNRIFIDAVPNYPDVAGTAGNRMEPHEHFRGMK
jgi:hypothetical protein